MDSTTKPIAVSVPARSDRAISSGLKRKSSMASWTRWRVSAATRGSSLSTREAVRRLTPAAFATSSSRADPLTGGLPAGGPPGVSWSVGHRHLQLCHRWHILIVAYLAIDGKDQRPSLPSMATLTGQVVKHRPDQRRSAGRRRGPGRSGRDRLGARSRPRQVGSADAGAVADVVVVAGQGAPGRGGASSPAAGAARDQHGLGGQPARDGGTRLAGRCRRCRSIPGDRPAPRVGEAVSKSAVALRAAGGGGRPGRLQGQQQPGPTKEWPGVVPYGRTWSLRRSAL